MKAAVFSWLAILLSLAPAWAQTSWNFAVSGDSRNCGDVVMPAIAAGTGALLLHG